MFCSLGCVKRPGVSVWLHILINKSHGKMKFLNETVSQSSKPTHVWCSLKAMCIIQPYVDMVTRLLDIA